MWTRGAAIRPVPRWAVVRLDVLEALEEELATDAETREILDCAFTRFEELQPALADRMADVLGGPRDESALALGYFLSVAVWLGFERAFGARLGEVSGEALRAAED